MSKRLFPILCLFPLLLQAADESTETKGVWEGQGELGFTATSGNTDSENLNASLRLSREKLKWKHLFSIEIIQAEAGGVTNSDSREARARSEYRLNEKSYSYGQARFQQDVFSGYDHQVSLVAGVGSRFIESDPHLLDLSIALGYRNVKDSEFGVTTKSGILSSDLYYEYTFSESAAFIQTLLIEAGEDNTYFQSETALRNRISGHFSSKISYQLKHNTDVTPSFEKTDQLITVSLVYDF